MTGRARKDAADQRGEAAMSRRALRRQRGASVAAFGLLLLCLGAGSAFADESSPGASGLPTPEEVTQAIDGGSQSNSPQDPDSEAAEKLPHQDLNRTEALELLQGVFEAQLQSPAGIFDELQVEKFLSPNVAVVAGDAPSAVASEAQKPEALPPESEGEEVVP